MLTVSVEFLHGTFRAAGLDDAALAGHATCEWPPSPARLYSAFVAADGTGPRCRVTQGTEGLSNLESPPVILAETDPKETRLVNRFVPVDERSDGVHVDYPARKGQAVRPGARVALRQPVVHYIWPNVCPSGRELAALQLRAARIPYLGCADSPVRVRVTTSPPPAVPELPRWEPDELGSTAIPVAFPGFLDLLDAQFDTWSSGSPQRRAWLPSRAVRYRHPDEPLPRPDVPELVWLRFRPSVSGRRLVDVSDTLRRAVLDHAARLSGGEGDLPSVLHGHATPRGGEHVRWLVLPHSGHEYADGRLHGACIWLPPHTPAEAVELVRSAAAQIRDLVRPSRFRTGVELFDGTRRPWASNPMRWLGPARRWVSVTPILHERHTRRGPDLAEVARWCSYAGLPEPISVRLSRVPLLPGSVNLAPAELGRFAGSKLPFGHLELTFDHAVAGPVVVGRGRHFGLGLCAPVGGVLT